MSEQSSERSPGPLERVNRLGRRSFLKISTWVIGGLISIGLGVPAIAYLIGPALKREQAEDFLEGKSRHAEGHSGLEAVYRSVLPHELLPEHYARHG